MKKKSVSSSGFLNLRALIGLILCAATACFILMPIRSGLAFLYPQAPANASQRTLTFEERVSYQRAIEDVYWRHRIWPKERPDPKPSLDAVMSQAQLEKKVEDYLRNSQALEDYWQRPILGAIWFDTKSNTHSNPYSDANTMHGQILSHAEAASDAAHASDASIEEE